MAYEEQLVKSYTACLEFQNALDEALHALGMWSMIHGGDTDFRRDSRGEIGRLILEASNLLYDVRESFSCEICDSEDEDVIRENRGKKIILADYDD